ncbi:uncharacterized protein PGRI_007000 [Penicillium griseofulvum]|uniref:Uncharacterized protein n=1 Tax=Penicillium patulum TaxID=5078 RepID=A0A135LXG2_PENPA|nr:uncharacterized protein PGRI_007000 [Penicillium griseofulvum]KXG53650.1 hypothetical protein PGRI_007000 [Penicillium griseofulvum]
MQGDCISGNNGYTSTERVYHHGSQDARAGTTLYKSGRSTGETTSVYHGLGSVTLDRIESKDGARYYPVITWVCKTSNAESSFPFAVRGDSGAWITRVDGKVFGILTGGDERQGTTLFCRINDVFDDIKDITGAVDIRIAPAPAPATVP